MIRDVLTGSQHFDAGINGADDVVVALRRCARSTLFKFEVTALFTVAETPIVTVGVLNTRPRCVATRFGIADFTWLTELISGVKNTDICLFITAVDSAIHRVQAGLTARRDTAPLVTIFSASTKEAIIAVCVFDALDVIDRVNCIEDIWL